MRPELIICWLVAAAQVLIGLATGFGAEPRLSTALLVAGLAAAGVLAAPLHAVLPTYGSLRKLQASIETEVPLRLSYAAMAALSCLTGSLFLHLYPWVVQTALPIFNILAPGASLLESTMGALEALVSPLTLKLLGASLVLTLLVAVHEKLFLERGPIGDVRRMYKRHALGYQLRRDEAVLKTICFGSGVAVSYSLNAVFLVLVAAGASRAALAPETWAVARGRRGLGDGGGFTFALYKTSVYATAFWIPFVDPAAAAQLPFAALIVAPIVCAVVMDVFPASPAARQILLVVKAAIAATAFVAAGYLQVARPASNPLLSSMLAGLPWLQGVELELLVRYCSNLVLILFLYLALALLAEAWSPSRGTPDGLSAYARHKAEIFVFSLALRVGLLPALWAALFRPRPGDIAWLEGVLVFVVMIMSSVLIQESDSAKFPRKTKAQFSADGISRAERRWGDRLRLALDLRDLLNLGWIFVVTLLVLALGHPALRIASLPALAFILAAYALMVADEGRAARKFLAFERKPGAALRERLRGWRNR